MFYMVPDYFLVGQMYPASRVFVMLVLTGASWMLCKCEIIQITKPLFFSYLHEPIMTLTVLLTHCNFTIWYNLVNKRFWGPHAVDSYPAVNFMLRNSLFCLIIQSAVKRNFYEGLRKLFLYWHDLATQLILYNNCLCHFNISEIFCNSLMTSKKLCGLKSNNYPIF